MLHPCSFIIVAIHTESQNVVHSLILGSLIFGRIFELVYRGTYSVLVMSYSKSMLPCARENFCQHLGRALECINQFCRFSSKQICNPGSSRGAAPIVKFSKIFRGAAFPLNAKLFEIFRQ